jgi:hypothetical protein
MRHVDGAVAHVARVQRDGVYARFAHEAGYERHRVCHSVEHPNFA